MTTLKRQSYYLIILLQSDRYSSNLLSKIINILFSQIMWIDSKELFERVDYYFQFMINHHLQIVMITRVIKQLQLALHKPNAFYFSGSDKFKGKGRTEKGGFFGRNKNKDEKKQTSSTPKTQRNQHKLFKTQQFQHAKQQVESKPHFRKTFQRTKQTQETKITQPTKVEQITLKLRKQPIQQPQSQVKVQEQQIEKGLAQSIIDQHKLGNNNQQAQNNPCVKMVELNILTREAFGKFTEESGQVLSLFDNKQWQKLQEKLQSYQTQHMTTERIVNTIHPLFINRQPVKYVQWVNQNNDIAAHLSHKLLRTVFNNLLNNDQYKSAKNWIKVLQNRSVDIGYQFMDLIFNSIDKNASLSILKATILPKIQFALLVLDFISNSRPTQPKFEIRSFREQTGYMLGSWFSNLWYIAKERHLFMTQFIELFEQFTIHHKKKINVAQIHANGLFLDVIENYYFGSHIGLVKLDSMFSHIFKRSDFLLLMTSFRNILMQYKVKTGEAPFPKINSFYEQLKQSLLLSQYKKALFYFQLCIVQGDNQPFQLFKDNPQLIKTISFQTNIDILKDGLLCSDKNNLKSKSKKGSHVKRSFYKQKIISKTRATQIQQFVSRDNKQKVTSLVEIIGLNKQFIDILANRDQTEVNPHNINREKLAQGNQVIQDKDQEYYLSQNDNENDEYGQIIQANQQLQEKFDQLKQLMMNKSGDSQQIQDQVLSKQQLQQLKQQSQLKNGHEKSSGTYIQAEEDDSEPSIDVHPFIGDINQFYKNQLKNQCLKENNFLRKELLKVVRLSSNPLHSIKAAIKLGKQEYAWTLFKQKIMKPLIKERMWKNIDYVVRAFVLQHSKNNHQYDIHQVMDSLHRFKYDFLDKLDRDSAQNQKEDYILKNSSFAQSIYQRLQNFDQLAWEHLPKGKLKHQFWQSTLVLERGQELLRLQANGKLKNFQYEREHYELQNNKINQIFPQELSWRDQLIYGLGITAPEQVPIKSYAKDLGIYIKVNDETQFRQYLLNPLMQKYCPPIKLRNSQPQAEIEGQVVEEQEVQAAEGEQTQIAQGEQVQAQKQSQHAQGQEIQAQVNQGQVVQGEQIQAVQGQHEVAIEGQEINKFEQQTLQTRQGEQTIASAQQVKADEEEVNATEIHQTHELMVKDKSIFEYSKQNKIKGYDFQAFMQINKLKLKPFFQKQYQQNQKQFKKYFLALQALVQEAYLYDNHSLQSKLADVESYIKDPYTIAKMTAFGLWNFDFVTVRQPYQYLQRSSEFIHNFFTFKKYMGEKLPRAIPNLKKQKILKFHQILHNRRVTHQLVEQLLIKRQHLFREAEAIVRIDAHQAVDEIILWGLFNDEPLAVYMGQKLAMLTNQKIPHKLAVLVARYLSHRRQVPQNRVERCKQALKIVGRINREHIYELSKDYEHITVRKHLRSYIQKRQQELDSSALQYLTRLQPTNSSQDTTFHLKNQISRGNLTV